MADSTVRVIFLGDSNDAVRATAKLDSRIGGLESSLKRAGKAATAGIGVALVGGLIAAERAAISFDKSMRNVNSIAKLSEKQFQAVEKQVLALGKATGQGPTVLANGLYDIVSSGFKANDALKILKASAIAATAGLTDTATSSKAIVAVLNAYQMPADKARKVSSLLFKEVQLGVNTFGELAQNLGDTAPLAAALKIPFSDVAAALALITKHGTPMAEASTQVARVMTDLLKPSKALSAELKSLGYENGQAAIQAHGFVPLVKQLSDAAGGSAVKTADWFQNIRSLRGILNLTGGNLKEFNSFAAQTAKSMRQGGDDTKAFNEQSKSIAVQWSKASAAFAEAEITLGTKLFPTLSHGMLWLSGPGLAAGTSFVDGFTRELGSLGNALAPIAPAAEAAGKGLLSVGSMSGTVPAIIAGTVAYGGLTRALLGVQLAQKTVFGAPGMSTFAKSLGQGNLAGAGTGLAKFATSITGVGLAAGITVGTLVALASAEESVGAKARRAAGDLLGLQNAQLGVRGATIEATRTGLAQGEAAHNLAQANHALKASQDTLRAGFPDTIAGHKAQAAALADVKAKTEAAKVAQNQYDAAHLQHVQAEQSVAQAREAMAAATDKAIAKITDLAKTNEQLTHIAVSRGIPAGKVEAATQDIKTEAVRNATAAISAQIKANAELRPSVAAGFQAVLGLISEMGKLPAKKTLSLLLNDAATGKLKAVKSLIAEIRSKTVTVSVSEQVKHPFAPRNPINPTLTGKAAGDRIDHPMLAMIGEDAPRWPEWVIPSNPQHRTRALGLLGAATSALGLPGFARGGGPASGHHYTGHQLRPRTAVKAAVGAAQSAINSLTAAQQRVADLGRTYDQDQRAQGAVNLPPLTVDVPDDPSDPTSGTHQEVNPAGVAAATAQLNQLVTEKGGILQALEVERQKIEAAITAVQKAIDDLMSAIKVLNDKAKAEGKNARSEHAQATAATNSVSRKGGLQDQIAAERAAKKPNKARITQLANAIRQAGRDHDAHEANAKDSETNQGRYQKQAGDDASKVSDLRGTLAGLMTNRHDLPFDVRDQQIDVAYLQQQIGQVQGTTGTAPGAPSAPSGGGSTTTVGGATSVDDSFAAAIIAQLTQALGLQDAQLGVLGSFPSFASGIAYVPNDMVAQLHAGESVRTADQTNSDFRNSTAAGPITVYVNGVVITDQMDAYVEQNGQKIAAQVVGPLGRSADTLRRSNRAF